MPVTPAGLEVFEDTHHKAFRAIRDAARCKIKVWRLIMLVRLKAHVRSTPRHSKVLDPIRAVIKAI